MSILTTFFIRNALRTAFVFSVTNFCNYHLALANKLIEGKFDTFDTTTDHEQSYDEKPWLLKVIPNHSLDFSFGWIVTDPARDESLYGIWRNHRCRTCTEIAPMASIGYGVMTNIKDRPLAAYLRFRMDYRYKTLENNLYSENIWANDQQIWLNAFFGYSYFYMKPFFIAADAGFGHASLFQQQIKGPRSEVTLNGTSITPAQIFGLETGSFFDGYGFAFLGRVEGGFRLCWPGYCRGAYPVPDLNFQLSFRWSFIHET